MLFLCCLNVCEFTGASCVCVQPRPRCIGRVVARVALVGHVFCRVVIVVDAEAFEVSSLRAWSAASSSDKTPGVFSSSITKKQKKNAGAKVDARPVWGGGISFVS